MHARDKKLCLLSLGKLSLCCCIAEFLEIVKFEFGQTFIANFYLNHFIVNVLFILSLA